MGGQGIRGDCALVYDFSVGVGGDQLIPLVVEDEAFVAPVQAGVVRSVEGQVEVLLIAV